MLNISTEYPLLKGDADTQLVSLQNTVCSLLDELKVIFPQLDNKITTSISSLQSGDSTE